MMAFRSYRNTGLSGPFTKLAGLFAFLLFPMAALSDEPPPTAPAAAAAAAATTVPPGSAGDPESQVPGLLAGGRCDLALQTLLTMEPRHHHTHEAILFCRVYHQCGEPKDTVATCSVVVGRSDVFSSAEREEAQAYVALATSLYQPPPPYGGEPAVPLPPVNPAVSVAPVVPSVPAPEIRLPPPSLLRPYSVPSASERLAAVPWSGQSRFYFHARPVWSLLTIFGGALVDVGFEHIFKSGFLIGAELAPIALTSPIIGIQGRARIGYGSRQFTIGLSLGSGYPLYFPNVGFFFRAGRLDRTYVEFSLSWAVPAPFPLEGLLHISAKTSEHWRFKMDIGGTYYLFGPYFLLGGERRLSGDGVRRNTAVNFGLGLVFPVIVGIPGPMLSVGYEKRF